MKQPAIRTLLFLTIFLLFLSGLPLHAQTAATTDTSLLPAPKPKDAPLEWKQLVGLYDYSYSGPTERMIFLEKDQRLFMQPEHSAEKREEIHEKNGKVFIADPHGQTYVYDEQRDKIGGVTSFSYLKEHFVRADAGSDPAHFYHIIPSKPLDQLRAAALAAKPPAESGPFRKPDLVELAALDPAFHLDIRYAQSNNFLSTPVYTEARAFMQRPAAEALLRVLHKLQPLGYGLLIHDAYRPWYVTKIFWDATPPEGHNFVADPKKGSRHNRGCAVDLTLYDLATGQPIEMPGLYDEMSPRSFPDFPGGTSLQRWHRDLLRRAMESEGFTVNEDEWWHFDYKDWKFYSILNVRFEDLHAASPAGVF
ncbi:MAG TPA: M15 family metallopeptidase [Candidatus Acidoferrum sp.]|nr:M15 family metallopeptidase [Candidatus Acidoferrum sp.]